MEHASLLDPHLLLAINYINGEWWTPCRVASGTFIAEEMSAGFYLSLGDSMGRKDTDIERYPSDPAMGGACVGEAH